MAEKPTEIDALRLAIVALGEGAVTDREMAAARVLMEMLIRLRVLQIRTH